MGMESISGAGSAPTFRSALRVGKTTDSEQSEIDVNQQKFLKEQQKAAEDLKKKQEQQQQAKEREQELDMLQKQLEASKKESEAMEDEFEAFSKCLKIASRISRGDIVPPKDMKYLAEHEPDLYKQAILLRMPNAKPKKHKSLIDDEDEKTDEAQGGESSGNAEEISDTPAVTETAPEESGGTPAEE